MIRVWAGATVGGGRLGGLKLVGIVSGVLIETPSLRCAVPDGTPWDPTHGLWHVAGVAAAAAAERARVVRTLRARRRRRQRRAQRHSRPARLGRGTPCACGRVSLSTLIARLARFSLAHRYRKAKTVDGRRDGRSGGRRVVGDGVGGVFTFKSFLCMCRVATKRLLVNVNVRRAYASFMFEKLKYIHEQTL